jgi:hypothetical protein
MLAGIAGMVYALSGTLQERVRRRVHRPLRRLQVAAWRWIYRHTWAGYDR